MTLLTYTPTLGLDLPDLDWPSFEGREMAFVRFSEAPCFAVPLPVLERGTVVEVTEAPDGSVVFTMLTEEGDMWAVPFRDALAE